MSSSVFLQHLVNGISLGFIFGLIAIGYTLVYGVVKLVNFAHGDVFMMATFFVFYGFTLFMMPWWLAVLFGIIATILLGVGIERVAYRPLREAPRISSLCAAIGMSFLLQNIATVVFGGRQKAFYVPPSLTRTFIIGGVRIQAITITTIVVSIVVLLLLTFLVKRTKMGLAMRALSVDFETAKLMGINVDRTIAFTFAIGSALAALSAILGSQIPTDMAFHGSLPWLEGLHCSDNRRNWKYCGCSCRWINAWYGYDSAGRLFPRGSRLQRRYNLRSSRHDSSCEANGFVRREDK